MINMKFFRPGLSLAICLTLTIALPLSAATKKKAAPAPSTGGREVISKVSHDPYLGTITIDAATGKVLLEDKADTVGYPASMVKLMDLLVLLDKINKGALKLDEKIEVNAEVSRIGGSGVYLKEHEKFSVDELIYAMMIQSANDAAAALAIHAAGSKEAFVQLMNARAEQLGMKSTKFSSVHGLPPARGQQPDVTTARDMSLLCSELVKHPEVLRYTSTRKKTFRETPLFIMETHNNLLGSFEGCDGLKTGYFTAAGFSLSATAVRNGRRVITVVLGSTDKKIRDAKAREFLATGFANLPPLPPPPPVVTNIVQVVTNKPAASAAKDSDTPGKSSKTRTAVYVGLSLVGIAVVIRLFRLASITSH